MLGKLTPVRAIPTTVQKLRTLLVRLKKDAGLLEDGLWLVRDRIASVENELKRRKAK